MSTKKQNMVYKCLHNDRFRSVRSKQCILCLEPSQASQALCLSCENDLPYLGYACRQCAIPLNTNSVSLCPRCQAKAPPQDHALCLFLYDAPIDQLISQLKFHQRLSYGRLLGDLMAKYLKHYYQEHPEDSPQAIIAVPLSRKRLAERGFNQAEILSRPIAKELNLPILRRVCQRNRDTPAQLSLPAKDRRRNLRDAFDITLPLSVTGEAIRHIALIDDVMTTGATLESLAKTVKKSGAETVTLWSLARTPLNI